MSTPLFRMRRRGVGSRTLALLLLATPASIQAQQPVAAVQPPIDLQLQLLSVGPGPDRFAVASVAQARLLEHTERARVSPVQRAVDRRPTVRLVAGGLAAGAAGALAGGLLGAGLRALGPCDDQDGCLDRYADWAVSGALLGQSLALPAGVHLANDRQGSLPPALLASAGIGTAGLLTYWGIRRYGTDEWGNTRGNPDALTAVTLVAMPVLELVVTIAIERATSRRRHGSR